MPVPGTGGAFYLKLNTFIIYYSLSDILTLKESPSDV
jgi:hypothetical protein